MAKTELRSEVEIDAPLAHVYAVLTDFESYHEWNPYLPVVRGELVVGSKLAIELSLPEGKTYELTPQVTHVTENSELRWRNQWLLPGLLEAEHFFQLREHAGKTRVMQGQDFSGFLLRFAGNSLTLAARGAVYMNQALKKRAESGT
ncbi:MAG TPA: SRPBCC domain-containing protein [Polyangiaceae bacterium]|nr:SRPBCC domain-containing protein [Polyangiaceae bacterium]